MRGSLRWGRQPNLPQRRQASPDRTVPCGNADVGSTSTTVGEGIADDTLPLQFRRDVAGGESVEPGQWYHAQPSTGVFWRIAGHTRNARAATRSQPNRAVGRAISLPPGELHAR